MPKKRKSKTEGKKTKTKVVKPQSSKTESYKKELQYDVKENIKPKKIVKKDIFEMMTR